MTGPVSEKVSLGRSTLFCGLLLLLTATVYWQVGTHEFNNFDDPDYVTANKMVQQGLSLEGVRWAFSNTFTGNWHPLTWLSHMVDCELFGIQPGPHHLVNLLFHLLNVLLLFHVLHRMTGVFWPSAFVAAVFALHPLNVEAVAWVTERKHLLSSLFWLLTLWAYVRYVEQPAAGRYLAVVGACALGLLAKPLLVTLPLVLLLLDYWPLGRTGLVPPCKTVPPLPAVRPFGRLVLEKVPLLALSLASSVVALLAARSVGGIESADKYSIGARVANALVSYVAYLGKMLLPDQLSVLYPHPGMWPLWLVLGATLVLVLISLTVLTFWRQYPYLLVGWLWFLGTLVPMIGLVQVSLHAMADRYAYLSLVGLYVAIAWGAAELARAWPRWVFALSGTLALAGCLVVTTSQLRHWKDSVTLFTHALRVTTNNPIAHYNLAQALSMRGQLDEPIRHYREALRLKPDYPEAQNNLGLSLMQLGKATESTNHYAQALRLKPNDDLIHFNYALALSLLGQNQAAAEHLQIALRLAPDNHLAHAQLAVILAAQNQTDQADMHFREALRLQPDFIDGIYRYARFLYDQRRFQDAANQLAKPVRLRPQSATAHARLGLALMELDKPDQAIEQLNEALRLDASDPEALNNLAWLLATEPQPQFRDGRRAVDLAQRACTLTAHKQPLLIGTLAAAYAEAGAFDQATAAAQQAVDLAAAQGLTALASTNLVLLNQYQKGQPFRRSH